MIKPEMLPKIVVRAAREALEECGGGKFFYLDEVAPAIAAALSAWPEMEEHINWPYGKLTHIILPLTQEKPDDKA